MGFKARLKAAAYHLAISVAVVAIVAGVVFGLWFPGPFSDMVHGKQLFLLVLVCDFTLGPLISLVIYNQLKPRAELVRDYVIVAVLQVAALIYGVLVVADTRPIYVVFVADRLEVVTASELDEVDMTQAENPLYRTRSWSGPQLVSVERPTSPEERSKILFSALDGKDIQLMPKYYRPYLQALHQIRERSLPIANLVAHKPGSATLIKFAVRDIGRDESKLRWLPVAHRFGFWVALIDAESGKPLSYVPVDPY